MDRDTDDDNALGFMLVCFLKVVLPLDIPCPDIHLDGDGDINLEYYFSKGNSTIVVIGFKGIKFFTSTVDGITFTGDNYKDLLTVLNNQITINTSS